MIPDGSQRKEGYRIIGTITTIMMVIKHIFVTNVGKTITLKDCIFRDPLIATKATKQATKPSFVTCIPNRKSAMGCQLNLIMIAFGLIDNCIADNIVVKHIVNDMETQNDGKLIDIKKNLDDSKRMIY